MVKNLVATRHSASTPYPTPPRLKPCLAAPSAGDAKMSELCNCPAMCAQIARCALTAAPSPPAGAPLSPITRMTPPPTSAVRASPDAMNGGSANGGSPSVRSGGSRRDPPPSGSKAALAFKSSFKSSKSSTKSSRGRAESLERWEGALGAAAVYEGAPLGWAMAWLLEQARDTS